jgi:hypothetical protein
LIINLPLELAIEANLICFQILAVFLSRQPLIDAARALSEVI